MVSKHNDIIEFIGNVADKDVSDIILIAEDETTMTERLYLKNQRSQDPVYEKCRCYAEQLKMLITYLRYGARPSGLPRESIKMLKPRYQS